MKLITAREARHISRIHQNDEISTLFRLSAKAIDEAAHKGEYTAYIPYPKKTYFTYDDRAMMLMYMDIMFKMGYRIKLSHDTNAITFEPLNIGISWESEEKDIPKGEE